MESCDQLIPRYLLILIFSLYLFWYINFTYNWSSFFFYISHELIRIYFCSSRRQYHNFSDVFIAMFLFERRMHDGHPFYSSKENWRNPAHLIPPWVANRYDILCINHFTAQEKEASSAAFHKSSLWIILLIINWFEKHLCKVKMS